MQCVNVYWGSVEWLGCVIIDPALTCQSKVSNPQIKSICFMIIAIGGQCTINAQDIGHVYNCRAFDSFVWAHKYALLGIGLSLKNRNY